MSLVHLRTYCTICNCRVPDMLMKFPPNLYFIWFHAMHRSCNEENDMISLSLSCPTVLLLPRQREKGSAPSEILPRSNSDCAMLAHTVCDCTLPLLPRIRRRTEGLIYLVYAAEPVQMWHRRMHQILDKAQQMRVKRLYSFSRWTGWDPVFWCLFSSRCDIHEMSSKENVSQ